MQERLRIIIPGVAHHVIQRGHNRQVVFAIGEDSDPEALQRGQLTGTQRFADEIERKLSIRVEHRGRGRPRRSQK